MFMGKLVNSTWPYMKRYISEPISKKVKNGKVRWILLKNISKPFINNQIDEEVLKKALKYSR